MPRPGLVSPLRTLAALALLGATSGALAAQTDTTRRPVRVAGDSTTVQGSIYNRPFMASVGRTALGGYVEGNTNYFVEDGIGSGFSMEFRRFNIFLFSPVGPRLRFFAELEFEHGTEEIALETAQLDWQLTPSVALRGGIILPPLGAFNQNHDSPRWEFIDRPLVSTRIIPATLSEVGFGAYGRLRPTPRLGITWDAYLTNGLGDAVVGNAEGRTSLAAGKGGDAFAEDNNGSPALSGRIAMQHARFGEFGLSYYGGVYNRTHDAGTQVDDARRVDVIALDVGTSLGIVSVRGEAAMATIDVPQGLDELFGSRQRGVHVDIVAPVLRGAMLGQRNAVVNVGVRLEHVDLNVGRFRSTDRAIGDQVTAIVPGVSLRPTSSTVFKANYRWERVVDFAGNAPTRRAGVQVGFATYF